MFKLIVTFTNGTSFIEYYGSSKSAHEIADRLIKSGRVTRVCVAANDIKNRVKLKLV